MSELMQDVLKSFVRGMRRGLQKAGRIVRRKDVSTADQKRAVAEYGKVRYADPVNKKYPLDSEQHVRSAWSYANMPKNATKYSLEALALIKKRIMRAAKKHGIEIASE